MIKHGLNRFAIKTIKKREYIRNPECRHIAYVQFHNTCNYLYYCDDSVLEAFKLSSSKGKKFLKHKVLDGVESKVCYVARIVEDKTDDNVYSELPPSIKLPLFQTGLLFKISSFSILTAEALSNPWCKITMSKTLPLK